MGAFDKCVDCKERYPACQDTCPIGKAQKQKYIDRQMKIRDAKAKDTLNREYVWEHYDGRKKR